jgi:tripartite-type tricarboxylate transporter receptor subunit TctC
VTSTGSLRAEKLARGIEGVNEIDNRIKSVPRYGRELSYPTRSVRVIGGFAAGGAFDITARLIGQSLSEGLGQPFVIENRSEAGGKFPAEAVARASADGHTLVLIGAPDAINATLYDKLNFSLVRDIAPVAGIIRLPSVMVVPSSFPAKTVPEVIAYARANPAALKMASAGNGSTSHALGELFQMMAGITITHAPYRGGAPAVADLLGGHAQAMFVVLPASIEHIKAGNLHPLAVTAATRLEALPDIPTLGEFLPGYEASGWQGIGAPKETPAHILSKLNKEINAGLAAPKMKARLANLGGALLAGSPADFGELIAAETEKWARVIKLASINVE